MGMSLFKLIEELPHREKRLHAGFIGLRRRRNRHQAAQPHAGQLFDFRGERFERIGLHARLRFLAVDIDFNKKVEGRKILRTLLGQAPGNPFTVNRLHPVEALGNAARFIGLKRPDEMPFERELRMVLAKPIHLGAPFLSVVFAECAGAELRALEKRLRAEGLPDSKKRHVAGAPPGLLLRLMELLNNVIPPGVQSGSQIGHGIPLKVDFKRERLSRSGALARKRRAAFFRY